MEGFTSVFFVFPSFLLLLCLVKAAYSLWWKPKKLEKQLRQQGINGNPYKILLGDVKEMGRSRKEAWSKPMNLNHQIVPRVYHYIHETVQNHGKVSVIWFGTTARVIINDPELMKEVLLNKSRDFHLQPLNPLVKLLAMGVSIMEGEKWAKHRKIISPAFHLDKLKGMTPAFSSSCSDLIKKWVQLVNSEGSCELDVWPELQNLTSDIISRTAFGSNYEGGKRIFELQKEQGILVIEAASSIYVPGFRYVPTKKNKRRMCLDKEIKSMLKELIHKKEQAIKMGQSSNDDLLGLLLQSSNCYSEGESNSKNGGLTIEEVMEECKLFYLAGQETTAVWLTWTMIILAMNPIWQEKAREEVLQMCGKNTPNFENTNHLKIVTLILYEVLRLYPPAPGMFRYTTKKTKLGEFSLPAEVEIFLATLAIHHDPEIWGEDAEEFRPERFAGGVSTAAKEHLAFFPFGWGPKLCLGQGFAMIEAKIALAMILQHFSFELSPSYTHAPYSVVTLQPQYGAQIILHQI